MDVPRKEKEGGVDECCRVWEVTRTTLEVRPRKIVDKESSKPEDKDLTGLHAALIR